MKHSIWHLKKHLTKEKFYERIISKYTKKGMPAGEAVSLAFTLYYLIWARFSI